MKSCPHWHHRHIWFALVGAGVSALIFVDNFGAGIREEKRKRRIQLRGTSCPRAGVRAYTGWGLELNVGEQLNTSHPWMLLFIVTRPPPQSLFQKKRQNKPPLKAFHCFPCFKKSGRAEGLGETWPFPRSRRYLAPVMLCFFAWPLRATNAAPQRRAGLSLGLEISCQEDTIQFTFRWIH